MAAAAEMTFEHVWKASPRQEPLELVAALPMDSDRSEDGRLWLQDRHEAGVPSTLPTTLWGAYGWSTWTNDMETAVQEAIASKSRTPPVASVAEGKELHWLIITLTIPRAKILTCY
jgi:hypothetical protein